MRIWYLLNAFGDCAVLLPVVLVTALWLLSRPATRRNGLLWALTVFACGTVVALSKLIYMGWGLGIPGLDFTGFSGHTALSSVIWPSVPALLVPARHGPLRRGAVGAGIALALGIAVSRLGLGVHSTSEVVLGGLLGFGFAAAFFKLRHAAPRLAAPAWQVGASLLLPLLLCYGHTFPTQHLLKDTAMYVSGHENVFGRDFGAR